MNNQQVTEITINPEHQNIADEVRALMFRNNRTIASVCPTNPEHTKYLVIFTEPK